LINILVLLSYGLLFSAVELPLGLPIRSF